jgi:hypothetical protein
MLRFLFVNYKLINKIENYYSKLNIEWEDNKIKMLN